MGLFSRKPKVIRELPGGTWGHMVTVHKVDVDFLGNDYRCVKKQGQMDGAQVLLVRVFRLSDLAGENIEVTGWETFYQNPDLVAYDGYLDRRNKAKLEKKKWQSASRLSWGDSFRSLCVAQAFA